MKLLPVVAGLMLAFNINAIEKKLYDFVVPRDGSFREALKAADNRADTTQRFRIFVMDGNYVIPVSGKTIGGDGVEYGDPRTRLNTPNVSVIGESREGTVLVNTTPPATWDNGFGPSCPLEGIGKGDVLIIEYPAHDTYLQDITMKSGMADHTGRNIVLHDRSDKTIAKNICIWGYQDTYVSNNKAGRFYFDGGVIRGRTDYICGKGDVYYDGVVFQQCGRGGYLAVPSEPRKYGYVMDSCYIKSETPDVTYYLGRPWGKGTPTAIWLNTKVDVSPITKDKHGYNGWADMSGGWPARFAEYNTYYASGAGALDLSGRRSLYVDREGKEHANSPVLTEAEAKAFTKAAVLDGWNPDAAVAPAPLPVDVHVRGGVLSWKGSDDALLYAVCRHGKVIDFTTETSYRIGHDSSADCWSVRAANHMGGLGEAVSARDAKAKETPKGSRYSKRMLRTSDEDFLHSDEARRIGDQVLLWQRVTGGWPKNIDMVTPMTPEEKAAVLADKERRDDSTTDNDATTTQMTYLARLYKATGDTKYRDGFRAGVDYLLSGQYKNGGWPQFWPVQRDYQPHITYNDHAMVNTMTLLRDIRDGKEPYGGDLCDQARKKKMKKAFDKGVECILATQIVVDGKPTVWCQQHDHVTLKPASARAYELPSFCSSESSGIVKLLMEIPDPDKRVKAAVHGAMAWFDRYKLTGLDCRRVPDQGKWNTVLVEDSLAGPLWARYYDLDNCIPFVCDRDGIPRRRLEDIGSERRNGYSWYSSRPAELYELYEKWADRYDPQNKVAVSLSTKGANENGTFTLGVQPKVNEELFDVVVRRGESIQAAIDLAPENGTEPFKILVKNGLYNQKVIIDRPNIVLVGENRDSCIIVGAEAGETVMLKEFRGEKAPRGILSLTEKANDCLISGLTVINNYGTTVSNTTTHQFAVFGKATRTIIINSNIISDGNDALSLWGKGDDGKGGLYYHSDLYIRCPGVDFICPRGTCYATRCRFLGDTRAILWHDGRGSRHNKFVVTNSEFDALKPTPLGRYHHDSQFYVINCHMTKNILDADINHAYKAQPELAPGKVFDPCPWGRRVYYSGCTRDGGHKGWLADNLASAKGAPEFYGITASWTFGKRWDPEKRIRDLWPVVAY